MADKKSVVITGSSNGFGQATAEAFLKAGWRTFATLREATGRNATAAAALRALGADVVELDVTSDASVDVAAAHIHAQVGAVDVLVNNAGTAFMGVTEAFTPAAAERQFATNVIGPIRVTRAFQGEMRQKKSGLVVYVSSVVGRMIFPFTGVYAASKWALEAYAESSSYELRPFGVDVAIVEPGAYGTNIFATMSAPDDAARVASYGDVANIMDRMGEGLSASSAGRSPSEVADVIVELAEKTAGTRPLRSVVPADPAVEAINTSVAPIQRAALEGFGLFGALLPKEVATV